MLPHVDVAASILIGNIHQTFSLVENEITLNYSNNDGPVFIRYISKTIIFWALNGLRYKCILLRTVSCANRGVYSTKAVATGRPLWVAFSQSRQAETGHKPTAFRFGAKVNGRCRIKLSTVITHACRDPIEHSVKSNIH